MANYERTLKSFVWTAPWFEELTLKQKVFYFLLHTGEETSDTGIFALSVKRIAYLMGISQEEARELIDDFQVMGILTYDYETGEALVRSYFVHNPPRGGLMYLGYKKDLAKVQAKYLIAEMAEIVKGFPITVGFFAAMQDHLPDLKETDYTIKKSNETVESTRTAQQRGLDKIAAQRNGESAETYEPPDNQDYDVPF